jgi:DNA-binding MarR family transcriptional regulator
MQEPAGDDLDRLGVAIGDVVRRARSYGRRAASDLTPEIPPAAHTLLGQLVSKGPVRSRDLSAIFQIDKAAISRQLGQLVDLDLVERIPDPSDGRSHLVAVTPAGRARAADAQARMKHMLVLQVDGWTAQQVADLRELLERFNATPPPLDAASPGNWDPDPSGSAGSS